MARYSESVINEVFAENDIVDYVSQYVALKKTGKDYSGLCPFHKEKSPSFHVSREKQLYHCFGCGASGNLVQFVQRTEGLDFVEALKLLADRAGIVLPEEDNRTDYELHEKKQRIYQMNQAAARFFHHVLTETPEGAPGLSYFQERRLSPKTIRSYGLGFALDGYTALFDHMKSLGYSEEELLEAGLITKREEHVYDRFRNRVIFPIIDLRGNVIGFGGRIMGDAKDQNGFKIPKYLNSAETPVFHKGRNLFSLNLAKKVQAPQIILAEGYMDVISVYQAGVHNVVATLGTALTEDQAKLLMKYCNEILLCYDSDEAGQKATIRAIEIINSVNGKARVIRLRGAKDPDEYIKANGAEAFRHAVAQSVPSTEYRISLARTHFNLDAPEGKIGFVQEAAEVLCSLGDAVEVDAYVKQVSAETEISKEAIYSEYKKKAAQKKRQKTPAPSRTLRPVQNPGADKPVSRIATSSELAEKKLLNLMIQKKKYMQTVFSSLTPEDFTNPIHRRLYEKIIQYGEADILPEPAMLVNDFSDDEMKSAAAVFYNLEEYENNESVLSELIINMKKDQYLKRIKEETDPRKINELFQQMANLGRNE